MRDYKKELTELQDTLNTRKIEIAKCEERLASLTEDKEVQMKELKDMGINDVEEMRNQMKEIDENLSKEIDKMKEDLGI